MVSNVTYGDVFGIGLFATAIVLFVDLYYTDYQVFIGCVISTTVFFALVGLSMLFIMRVDEPIIRKK